MGISISYLPKRPTCLTDAQLQDLGVESLCQRSSYLLARKMAKLNGRKTFMNLRSVAGIHWIDLSGGQMIPYQWDRRAYERRKRMMEAVQLRQSPGVLHAVLRPAGGRVPILEIKAYIAEFRKHVAAYNKSEAGPKILICKFEADCHFYGRNEAYLHAHTLFDSNNIWAVKKAWSAFATKHRLPKMVSDVSIVRKHEIQGLVSYLAKHPIMVCVRDKKYPLYHPRALYETSDANLQDIQEAMYRTQFIWMPRKPRQQKTEAVSRALKSDSTSRNLNIRPLFNDQFTEWLTQWINDYRHLQVFRGNVLPTPAEKRAFERQILKAYNDSRRNVGKWMPIGYFSEIGRVLINWPPP